MTRPPGYQDSGDGAGVMTAIPWDLLGVPAGERQHTGVGMAFLPQDPLRAKEAMQVIEGACMESGEAFFYT